MHNMVFNSAKFYLADRVYFQCADNLSKYCLFLNVSTLKFKFVSIYLKAVLLLKYIDIDKNIFR